MAYIICEPCISVCDTACVEVCPVDCIHPSEGYPEDQKEGKMLYIDPEECIDCGACEPECPVEAIFEESAVPPEWEKFIDINREYFEK
jgi:ferredoxin